MYPYHFRVIPLYNESAITFRDESFVDFLSLQQGSSPFSLEELLHCYFLLCFLIHLKWLSSSFGLRQVFPILIVHMLFLKFNRQAPGLDFKVGKSLDWIGLFNDIKFKKNYTIFDVVSALCA